MQSDSFGAKSNQELEALWVYGSQKLIASALPSAHAVNLFLKPTAALDISKVAVNTALYVLSAPLASFGLLPALSRRRPGALVKVGKFFSG